MKPRTIEEIQQEQESKLLKLLDVQERGAAREDLRIAQPTAESTERLRELLARCKK